MCNRAPTVYWIELSYGQPVETKKKADTFQGTIDLTIDIVERGFYEGPGDVGDKFSETAGFDDHPLETRHRTARPIGEQFAQRLVEIAAHSAADAAIAEQDHGLAAAAQKRMVDCHLAVFVDDDGGVGALRGRQQFFDQRCFAGAKKPSDDRHWDAGAAHSPLPPAKRRGAASKVFLREAARVTGAAATIHAQRVEAVDPASLGPVDAVAARAFAPLPLTLKLGRPWIARGAVGVFPRGESARDQVAALPEATAYAIELLPSLTDAKAAILRIRQN